MFKRVFWLSTGVAVGASGAFWAKRKVEETVEQYLPEQVAVRAAATAKGLGTTVRQAAAEGRDAMRATEAELRARVEARTFVGDGPEPPAPARETKPSGTRRAGRVATHAGTGPVGRRRSRR
ncbi:MAG: hypothetical protein JWO77_1359 [Ilumatobacteraceae bacterium]|nr:hypothetical protein [Ilumatobacteraceae bacterium]